MLDEVGAAGAFAHEGDSGCTGARLSVKLRHGLTDLQDNLAALPGLYCAGDEALPVSYSLNVVYHRCVSISG